MKWIHLPIHSSITIFHLIVVLVIAVGAVLGQTKVEPNIPSPPGRMVDVGGYRLHINCTGEGSPTVVMASGLGDYSTDWGLVQPQIARRVTRVCTYDRAGYAWSDPDPQPRSLQRAVDELHALLKNAEIDSPFVLVGHSWGGNIVRVFASQYPKEVVGMVLVDSSHEDRLEVINGKQYRVRLLSRDELRALFKAERDADEAREAEQKTKNVQTLPPPKPADPFKVSSPFNKLPKQNQQWRLWARSKGGVADVSDYREPLLLTFSTRAGRSHPLGVMPLIVLSSGRNYFEEEQGVPAATLFADHQKLQVDLANLSSNGKLIVASRSGHHIQLDEPKLVIKAIQDVVKESRSSKKNK